MHVFITNTKSQCLVQKSLFPWLNFLLIENTCNKMFYFKIEPNFKQSSYFQIICAFSNQWQCFTGVTSVPMNLVRTGSRGSPRWLEHLKNSVLCLPSLSLLGARIEVHVHRNMKSVINYVKKVQKYKFMETQLIFIYYIVMIIAQYKGMYWLTWKPG